MTPIQIEAGFVVTPPGGRVDRLIAEKLGVGRRRARELVGSGRVRLDGRAVRSAGTRAPVGGLVEIERASVVQPTSVSTPDEAPQVLWRSEGRLAVFKPAGYHSLRGRGRPSLAEFLADAHTGATSDPRFGIDGGLVHRLDRDTCGVMLAAANAETYESLRAAFKRGDLIKEYLALVSGRMEDARTIDVPLTRLTARVRAARRGERSRPAVTEVEPMEIGADWSLVRATMRTGVTHQIRAHLALVGFPVIGDTKYGEPTPGVQGHQLHARRITLADGLSVSSAPGAGFLSALAALRRDRSA